VEAIQIGPNVPANSPGRTQESFKDPSAPAVSTANTCSISQRVEEIKPATHQRVTLIKQLTELGKPVVDARSRRVEPKRIARGDDADLKCRLIRFGI